MGKRKPATTWVAYKITGAKARLLGYCHGETEAEALRDAYRTFNVTTEVDQKRIILRGE